ncbi:MAG: caspase family protein [Pseudomonadota bacterium]
MKRFDLRLLSRCVIAAVALIAAPVEVLASRVALVIGNSGYQHTTPLANPRNDAEAIASKLRTLGFDTIEGYDLGVIEMSQKAREFAQASRTADLALFFYAGHGIQVDGKNYLVPIDAAMKDELAIDFEAFPIDVITKQMSYTQGANLIILDACRDNPFAQQLASSSGGTRSIGSGGLSEMDVRDSGVGTGIAFATSPGDVALDGTGQHSPFTEALLKHIGTANEPITTVMSRVTGEVYAATDQKQRPWFNQSFTGDVVLFEASLPAQQVTAEVSQSPASGGEDDERFMFDIARDSGHIEDYEAYLEFYPNGRYARFARIAIERLRTEEGTQQAALDPSAGQGTSASRATGSTYQPIHYDPNLPLALTPTQHLRATTASQVTEQALQMDRNKRREVQARLNATGNNVGYPDGAFGPKTRGGIGGWQQANGLPVTQYLNSPQLDLLTAQTQATYLTFLNVPAPAKTVRRTSSSSSSQRTGGNAAADFGNSIVEGIGQGLGNAIGNKIFGN